MPITGIIPSQNFELVRDRIGQILALEFANQYVLTSNDDINVTVYNDRIIPFDKTDTPCINVVFASGNYPSKYEDKQDGSYTFNIDCYCTAPSTSSNEGGKKANQELQKILGIVRAILSNPLYRTLNFPMPSLSHVSVSGIQIASPENKQDASSMVMGRVTFMVNVIETVELSLANTLAGSITSVKMEETDLGYYWVADI
jgi:hypothetical protein